MTDAQKELAMAIATAKDPIRAIEVAYEAILALKSVQRESRSSDQLHRDQRSSPL